MPSTNAYIESQIAAYLEAHSIGTIGTDLFVGEIPSTSDNDILVMPAPGPQPDRYLDTETAHLSIYVRHNSTSTARANADLIFRTLNRLSNVTMGQLYVYFVGALGDPFSRDRDGQDRQLYQVDFEVIFHKP